MNSVKIRKGNYLRRRAVIMDNGTLSLVLLPAFGFKMASLFYKPTGFESLFQPATRSYKKPTPGTCFEKYDTSGCDDLLPTIDANPGTVQAMISGWVTRAWLKKQHPKWLKEMEHEVTLIVSDGKK